MRRLQQRSDGLCDACHMARVRNRPCRIFTEEDLDAARSIGMARNLGFSPREIAAPAAERWPPNAA